MLPKLTPWIISQITKASVAPVVSYFTYWKTYWETLDMVKWPESPYTTNKGEQ